MCPTQHVSGERDASSAPEHAVALLSPADVDFIRDLSRTTARGFAEGQGLGGLLEAISHHLNHFEQDVRRVEAWDGPQPELASLLSDPWGLVTAERDVLNANTVVISGPGAHDRFEVVGSSPDEAVQTVSAEG